jgi:uncharacterized protein (TIGR03492 family)
LRADRIVIDRQQVWFKGKLWSILVKLLFLSNGHGEDVIAAKILQELQQQCAAAEIVALPIVGKGQAYRDLSIPIWGDVKTMPSGGFNQDGQQLWRDMQGGLLQLTIGQWQAVKRWAKAGGKILAVGDIVPLLMARYSGAAYGFVGTAKSEYYLVDSNQQPLGHRQKSLEARSGSIYFPWERWLMRYPNCQGVFPRDRITTEKLNKLQISAWDLGNPMMDGLQDGRQIGGLVDSNLDLRVTILPGSRPPEAYRNWQILVAGLENLGEVLPGRVIEAIAGITPSLDVAELQKSLQAWQFMGFGEWGGTWQLHDLKLHLAVDQYAHCLAWGDVALAMAGTATEQFVGLGKPALVIPGAGPQFTQLFAERQCDLLGESVILVNDPQAVGLVVRDLVGAVDKLAGVARNGRLRMGEAGAAARIATKLLELWEV